MSELKKFIETGDGLLNPAYIKEILLQADKYDEVHERWHAVIVMAEGNYRFLPGDPHFESQEKLSQYLGETFMDTYYVEELNG